MPTLSTEDLLESEVILRRAHLVLTFMTHIFVHSLPPAPSSSPIRIPPCLSVPLLRVSSTLGLPPILTYSDNVLYNWKSTTQSPNTSISSPHIRSQTTFTGTPSEEHFYLTSARIELAGVSALSLLRLTMNEASVGDLLSLRRISQYLTQLATVIDAMTAILKNVQKGCIPRVFYDEIRPWFRGPESRPWFFEGADAAGLPQPQGLVGPSAAQSSLIHVLDIFLGVDSRTSEAHLAKGPPFLERMQSYMPRRHRAFLDHLKANPRPVRNIVECSNPVAVPEELGVRDGLKDAYNAAVMALKRFRDEHLRIATLYIVTQARRGSTPATPQHQDEPATERRPKDRGTGGTELVPFLKGVRDSTAATVLKI